MSKIKKIMSIKIKETSGFTREQALENEAIKSSFTTILKDATQKWKNSGSPMTGTELRTFCEEYIKKNTKNAEGVACSITVTPGSADTRERPYTFEDIKNEKGVRKYKTGYQGIDEQTGEILFTVFETKAKAMDVVRDLYKDGYKGNIYCKYVKEVTEGEVGAFRAKYTPSKSAKVGKYLVFGVESNN